MVTNQAKSKRRLKPFRLYLAEGYRRSALSEEVAERVIMEAKAVVIGNDMSPNERELIIEGFSEAIRTMNDSGGKIIATAVVVE
jgi:hypothetical protein